MRISAVRYGLAALALVGLASCSGPTPSAALAPVKTDAKALEARLDKLEQEAFTLKSDKPAAAPDIAGLAAALPKAVKVTWDKLDFDSATGASTLHNFKITPADNTAVGVSIAELKIWGLDAELAKSRLAGQRLAESAPLARRIDARTIAAFGLESLMGDAMAASNALVGALPGVSPAAAAASKTTLKNYQLSMSRVIFDDVRLRPWELQAKPLPADDTWAKLLPTLQTLAASSRSFAFDTEAMEGLKAELTMAEGDQDMAMSLTAERMGVRGLRGGDEDFALLKGLKGNFDMAMPLTPDSAPKPTKLAFSIDNYTMENMRLDKLAGYLARGLMPPRTDTNLLSLGIFRMNGESYSIDGHPLTSTGSVMADMTGFYWLVPTHIRYEAKDISYDISNVLEWVKALGGADAARSIDEYAPKVMAALKAHKLDKPTLDGSLSWDWNAATGDTQAGFGFGLHDYFKFDAKANIGLPDFKSVSDLIPAGFDSANQKGLSDLFSKASTLKSSEMTLTDTGGLDQGFALAVDLAAIMPPDTPGMDFMSHRSPASLRQLAYSAMYSVADEAGKEMPALRNIVRAAAAFVEKGGVLKASVKPDKPIVFTSLDDPKLTPQQVMDMMRLAVVATPPAGAKQN